MIVFVFKPDSFLQDHGYMPFLNYFRTYLFVIVEKPRSTYISLTSTAFSRGSLPLPSSPLPLSPYRHIFISTEVATVHTGILQ